MGVLLGEGGGGDARGRGGAGRSRASGHPRFRPHLPKLWARDREAPLCCGPAGGRGGASEAGLNLVLSRGGRAHCTALHARVPEKKKIPEEVRSHTPRGPPKLPGSCPPPRQTPPARPPRCATRGC